MSLANPGKELPVSRIPTLARSPVVAPLTQTTSRQANKSLTSSSPQPTARPASRSLTSSSPRPPTAASALPPSRPASRSVTTRSTSSTAVKVTKAASPATTATPSRPTSRSVSRTAAPSATAAPAPSVSASKPATRSTSRSVTSSSSTASSSSATISRIKPAPSPATRPASRSVARPTTARAATPRTSAPNTKATNSPAPASKAATATTPTVTSPLTLAAIVNDAIPTTLALPPQAVDTAPPDVVSTTTTTVQSTQPTTTTADTTPADVPPPTDPSVPIYHAPHYKQEVHHTTRGRKRSSLTQPIGCSVFSSTAEELESKVNEWREEYLAMSIEEVADWLQRVLGDKPLIDYVPAVGRRETLEKETTERAHRVSLSISHPLLPPPSPLFDALQTGVLLCQLALAIDTSLTLRYKQTAPVGSFFARDNLSSFLSVALSWGVLRSQLFEVDDLVMRKNDRGVVNSLLDITRVVYIRFPHVLPPQLVQFELEIAALEAQPLPPPPPPPPPQPSQPPPPPAVVEPAVPAKPKGPRYLPYIADESDPLDVAVGRIVNGHQLDTLVKRVVKGQYWIAEEKVHHLRLVRHLVLVRVGGGWEGLLPMTSRKILEGVGENDGSGGVAAATST